MAPNGAVITIVPVGTAHVGCAVTLAVAAAIGTGAFTGTEVGPEIHDGFKEFLAKIVCEVPPDTPAKVTEDWYAPPSILYSIVAPSGAVTTIVPVGTAQVGCTVTLAVGAAGAVLTVTANVLGALVPQPLAATVILPLTAPAPADNVIDVPVEVPVQPAGLVHV